jgi:flagellar biosynthesis/type III secretory pathway protein FliH
MGVVEIIIADAKVIAQREGMAEGLEKGMEKGLARGLEKGMEKGLARGLEKGIEKGIEKGKEITESKKNYEFTKSLLQNCPEWSDEKIATIVGVSSEYVLQVRNEAK